MLAASFVILAIALGAALMISVVMIRQVKLSKDVESSLLAVLAAETGMEEMTNYYYSYDSESTELFPSTSDSLCPNPPLIKNEIGKIEDESYGYCVTVFDDSGIERNEQQSINEISAIKTIGTYKNTKRAVQVNVK